jgi:hypothetical protein
MPRTHYYRLTSVPAPIFYTQPETVNDVEVTGTGPTAVTLQWTAVDDGGGRPARYALRYEEGDTFTNWGDAYPTEQTAEAGVVGDLATYTWTLPTSDQSYGFRLVSYRGTLNLDAEFGGLSNIVDASTDPSAGGTRTLQDTATFSENLTRSITEASGEATKVTALLADTFTLTDNLRYHVTGTGTQELHQNEPVGYTQIHNQEWNSQEPTNWSITLASGNITTQTDATAPLSPSNVMRFRYQAGAIAAGKSRTVCEIMYDDFLYKDDIYVEFAIKFSTGYRNHDSTTSKLMWIGANTGGGGDPFYFNAKADNTNDPTGNFFFSGQLQHPNLQNRSFEQNLTGNSFVTRDQWYHVEMILRMNTPGNADGEFHMWVDGTKVTEYTNIQWSNGPGYTWTRLRWTPLWGGQNDSIPTEFYIYVDHTYFSYG